VTLQNAEIFTVFFGPPPPGQASAVAWGGFRLRRGGYVGQDGGTRWRAKGGFLLRKPTPNPELLSGEQLSGFGIAK